jgi:hypothetical protein
LVEITDFERSVGRHVQGVFGPSATARRYGDDYNEYKVALVHGPDCPVEGITSYSTVGLSNFTQDVAGKSVRAEIVSAAPTGVPDYDLTVSSCFFEHVRNGTNIVYGSVIPNIVGQYGLSKTMVHFTFVAPFVWPALSKAELAGVNVYWLYAIPISDAERRLIHDKGIDALETLFDHDQIDAFDLNRESVV